VVINGPLGEVTGQIDNQIPAPGILDAIENGAKVIGLGKITD
jgi:hypothetical protein